MIPPRHIAVLDVGKTNAKLALVDGETLQEIAVVTRPNRALPCPPYPQFDLDGHWAFLSIISERFMPATGSMRSRSPHGTAAALRTAQGALATPMLDYEHSGPEDTAAAV